MDKQSEAWVPERDERYSAILVVTLVIFPFFPDTYKTLTFFPSLLSFSFLL